MISQIKNLLKYNKQADKVPAAEPVATDTVATDAVATARTDKQTAVVTNSNKLQDAKTIAAQRVIDNERLRRNRMPVFAGLERFELLEKIGDGAFSVVYKAHDLTTGKDVAVKAVRKREVAHKQDHLHPKLKKKPRATERANILKEVQIMQKCKHPNLVSLVHFSETEDYFFLCMELCPGGELFHQIVTMTYFSEDLARHVIVQVAQGIRFLHEECGIVHRDIKPENILFDPVPIIPSKVRLSHFVEDKADEGEFTPGIGGGGIGTVKLADFGLSKVIWDDATKTPCGTVGYTAPEILRDQTYSKGVDMWALGCVLYTMLCGFPPFYDESISALTQKVARGQYTFLSPWWDPISDTAKDLISHLLTVDPEQRYTIDEFLNHPWITQKKGEQRHPPALLKPPQPPSPVPAVVIDTPAAVTRRRKDVFSPGVASFKEILDITYAVHRIGEENARKLSGLAEEVEEEDDDDDDHLQAQRVDAATGGTKAGGFNLDMKKATLLKKRKNIVPVTAA